MTKAYKFIIIMVFSFLIQVFPQQQWIWHTGEDVIVAVKSEQRPFLLSYRPSLLDPSFL